MNHIVTRPFERKMLANEIRWRRMHHWVEKMRPNCISKPEKECFRVRRAMSSETICGKEPSNRVSIGRSFRPMVSSCHGGPSQFFLYLLLLSPFFLILDISNR
uniref:Uncharacterized protein n=1 Tax=Entomoneis paludosa TaxID=265537 RepID=A0A7S2YGV5_9STRA